MKIASLPHSNSCTETWTGKLSKKIKSQYINRWRYTNKNQIESNFCRNIFFFFFMWKFSWSFWYFHTAVLFPFFFVCTLSIFFNPLEMIRSFQKRVTHSLYYRHRSEFSFFFFKKKKSFWKKRKPQIIKYWNSHHLIK